MKVCASWVSLNRSSLERSNTPSFCAIKETHHLTEHSFSCWDTRGTAQSTFPQGVLILNGRVRGVTQTLSKCRMPWEQRKPTAERCVREGSRGAGAHSGGAPVHGGACALPASSGLPSVSNTCL